jgi:hypothetical protein
VRNVFRTATFNIRPKHPQFLMNGGRFQFSTFKIARGRFETEPLTKPTTKIVLDSVCRHINQRAIGKRFFQVVRCSQIGQVCFRFSNGRLGIILHRKSYGRNRISSRRQRQLSRRNTICGYLHIHPRPGRTRGGGSEAKRMAHASTLTFHCETFEEAHKQ